MSSRLKQSLVAALTTILLITISCGATLWLHRVAALRPLEFQVYDRWMDARPSGAPGDSPCLIVGMTDTDIGKFGYPISDEVMTDLIVRLLRAQPAAIGLDVFRDQPVGGNERARQEFLTLIRDNPIGIPVKLIDEDISRFIGPPETFALTGDQVTSINTVVDPDGVIRRGLLYRDVSRDDHRSILSLGYFLSIVKTAGQFQGEVAEARTARYRNGMGPFQGRDLDDAGYQFLLDFRGPRTIRHVNVDDVLADRVPAELIRGRVVIIGITAFGVKDHIRTPLKTSDSMQHGAEYHARVVDQLLRAARGDDVSMRFWSDRREMIWTLLFCVLGAAVGWSARPPGRLFAGATGSLIALVAGAIVLSALWFGARSAFQRNLFVPVIPPAFGFLTTTGLVAVYSAVTGRRDRSAMMQLIGHYVSDDVAELIWSERADVFSKGRLRTRRLRGTVLFTDLKGFSTISEQLSAQDLMRWLNQYFQGISGLVKESGGIIMKFNGDQIVAVFGPPRKRTLDESAVDARNAVRCAIRMRQRLTRLNARWARQDKPQAQMRIGIHTGGLVAGSLGSRQRMEWTVIGDTVNTAARLESVKKDLMPDDIAADGCRILISDTTAKMLDLSFDVRPLGKLPLRGKRRRVVVHGVKGFVKSRLRDVEHPTVATITPKKDSTC